MRTDRRNRPALEAMIRLALLIFVLTMSLNGASAHPVAISGTVPYGTQPISGADQCAYNVNCILFGGSPFFSIPTQHVGNCSYTSLNTPIYDNNPFVNIVDISAFTAHSHTVEFTLVSYEEILGDIWREALIGLYDKNCSYVGGADPEMEPGDKDSFTIPAGTKWLLVTFIENAIPNTVTRDFHWTMTFPE